MGWGVDSGPYNNFSLTNLHGEFATLTYIFITIFLLYTRPLLRRPNFPETYFGYVGKHFRQMFIEDSEEKVFFTKIIRHPEFDALTYSSDIALLKVNKFIRLPYTRIDVVNM